MMKTLIDDFLNIKPYIEVKNNDLIERFANNAGFKEDDDSKPFNHMWEIFVWCCILGFTKNQRVPLTSIGKDKDTKFNYNTVFKSSEDIVYALILMAVSVEGVLLLSNASKVNTVIMEFANGGFNLLRAKVQSNPQKLSSMMEFIYEINSRKNEVITFPLDSFIERIQEGSNGQNFEI